MFLTDSEKKAAFALLEHVNAQANKHANLEAGQGGGEGEEEDIDTAFEVGGLWD